MAKDWPIGAFTRPWGKFSYAEALAGMKQAGYALTGLLGSGEARFDLETLGGDEAAALRSEIAAAGLSVNMACLKMRHDVALDEALASVQKQIENATPLGIRYLMTFGADHEEHYARWYALTRAAAAHAEPRGMQVVFKPHGGCTSAADDLQRCLDQIAHPNAKIWYDAGNILYYNQGKDPVDELRPIAKHVSGFCAKDCGGYHSDVMIPFGDGAVDFAAVFSALADAGFDGPIMVECCGGTSYDEITRSAAANRAFLENVLAAR